MAKAAESADEFVRVLDHPLKPVLLAVRSAILGANLRIGEGIKWNAPSYFVREGGRYFATVNIHTRGKAGPCVLVILHRDATPWRAKMKRPAIGNRHELLTWLANDRCAARFRDAAHFAEHEAEFREIVREWIAPM